MKYNNLVICLVIFLISFFLFTGTMSFFYTIDSLPNNLTAMNFLLKKRVDLDNLKKGLDEKKLFWITVKSKRGIAYSRYTPLVGILSVPTFWLLNKYFGVDNLSDKQLVFSDYVQYIGKLSAAFYASLSAVLLFLIIMKVNKNKLMQSFVITLVYSLCTNIFNTASQANFQHAFSLFFINLFLLIFITNYQNKFLLVSAGLTAGIFSQIRFTNIFYLLFVLIFYLLSYKKLKESLRLIYFLSASIFVYAIISLINIYLQLPNGYLVEIRQSISLFTIPSFLLNMISLLFSLNYGLFFFSPILILALLPIFKINLQKRLKFEEKIIVSLIPTLVIFIISASAWWGWTGGKALNARLITESLPIFILLLNFSYKYFNSIKVYRFLFCFLFLISFLINILTTYFMDTTYSWHDLYTIHDPKGLLTPKYERRNAWFYKPMLFQYLIKNKQLRIVRLYKKNKKIIAKEIILKPSLKYLNVRKVSESEIVILDMAGK